MVTMKLYYLIINFLFHQGFYASDFHLNIHDETDVKHHYNIHITEHGPDGVPTKIKQFDSQDKNGDDELQQNLSKNLDNILIEKANGLHSDKPREFLKNVENFYTDSPMSPDRQTQFDSSKPWTSVQISSLFGMNPTTLQYTSWLQDSQKLKQEALQQLQQPLAISAACSISGTKEKLPFGLCFENLSDKLQYNQQSFKKYASEIVDKKFLPHATGKSVLNKKIAHAIVLLNTGHTKTSIAELTKLIKDHSSLPLLYYTRSVAYLRENESTSKIKALEDIEKAMKMETTEAEPHERKAAIYTMMGNLVEAIPVASRAVQLHSTWQNLYRRGLLYFLLESFTSAEKDFRRVLELKENDIQVMHYLGLVLFQRGKLRNAMNIFKEILELDPSRLQTILVLAEAQKRIGDCNNALKTFKKALLHKPSKTVLAEIYQSRAGLFYSAGQIESALKDTQECLQLDANNQVCLYLRSVCYSSLGQFYNGIKTVTKLMVLEDQQPVRISPEFIKAHYLREWSRYLHARLEHDLMDFNISQDLSGEFRDKWMKNYPMEFVVDYQEQIGLQPHIPDVTPPTFASIPNNHRELLCTAQRALRLFSMASDGHVDNERVMFAMAIASIHTAQLIESHWNTLLYSSTSAQPPPRQDHASSNKKQEPISPQPSTVLSWRSLLDQTARYLTLADPDNPVLWVADMPHRFLEEGYPSELMILRGEEESHVLMPYYDLIFHILKTMIELMNSSGGAGSSNDKPVNGVNKEVKAAKNCQELLRVAKKKGAASPNGGVYVSTRVPSVKYKEALQHEGDVIVLSEDSNKKPILGLQVHITRTRLLSYFEELDFIFGKYLDEGHHARQKSLHNPPSSTNETPPPQQGVTNDEAAQGLVDRSLTLLYYLCNARPLSHSNSLVGYSMTLGMIMALGYEVHGRVPAGKLLEMEPMLSGTPDAFVTVSKKWLRLNRVTNHVSQMSSVNQSFQSVRNILEALSIGPTAKCN